MTTVGTLKLENNLTLLEMQALRQGLNLSDGHPRMPLTTSQRAIVNSLPRLFEEAWDRTFEDVEREAQLAFLEGIGQYSAPVATGRLVSCYSSSVAIDIVARTLAERTTHVALVHPTFDNIPDLLRARGITLVPASEAGLASGEPDLRPEVGAIFVTSPNNPTGWVLGREAMLRLGRHCQCNGRVLVFDSCFRAQDERAQYDAYEALESTGVEWVVVEDTGKLWPTLELKAGFLAWGTATDLPLLEAFSDVLLSVSPVALLLIRDLALDAKEGGYASLRQLILLNREVLRHRLDGLLTITDPESRIGVARVTLPSTGPTAWTIHEDLVREGVHTLPCDAFYWADRQLGSHQLRVALSRSTAEVSQAGLALASVVRGRRPA